MHKTTHTSLTHTADFNCNTVYSPVIECAVAAVGARHAGDSVAVGVRQLYTPARDREEQRLLRVHQAAHRQVRHTAVWSV